MKAGDKYKKVFGSIHTLSDEIPWTTGLSNMMEFLLWETRAVLGISKTQFWKLILSISNQENVRNLPMEEKQRHIEKHLSQLLSKSDVTVRYQNAKATYCSPREALRRNKYFSEDYLNKEFDIFLSLCSDRYLDELYSLFIDLNPGGNWSTHGNSGLFACSTEIEKMQMDNLAYNSMEKILVANELKLGGHKNPDQILKYAYMLHRLIDIQFIDKDTTFLLLFISDKQDEYDLGSEIASEIEYCRLKKNRDFLIQDEILIIARTLSLKCTTWSALIEHNEQYSHQLTNEQQVEKKLINGFNTSLREKAHMQFNS